MPRSSFQLLCRSKSKTDGFNTGADNSVGEGEYVIPSGDFKQLKSDQGLFSAYAGKLKLASAEGWPVTIYVKV